MKFLSSLIRKILKKIPFKVLFFISLIFATGFVLAQGTPAAEPQSDSDVIRAIVQILNLVFTLITFLLTPAIILAGWLLSPDWTMGDFFGLRPYFIRVWVLVSNLVYIIFALMLLWMAVMQIFSGESEFAFKQKLPRFLVGIMIVPFTWLIVSWTLSFANQAVAAVLSIPSGAISGGLSSITGGGKDKGLFHQKTIPTKFELNFGADAPGTPSCQNDGYTEGGESDGIKCISPAEFIAFNESGPFFIIMVYAYDIFKIQNTEAINFEAVCAGGADVKACVKGIGELLRKFGVALITTVFFAIILIALCWVLLARAFKLWIYIMFSPLFGLAYAVSKDGLGQTLNSSGGSSGSDGGGSGLGKVGFLPFFQLAMVPVLVSAVLSFGLLFIGVMNQTFTTGSMAPTGSGGFCTKGDFMVKYCIEEDGAGGYSSRLIIGNSMNPSGGEYNITFEFGSMMSGMVGNSAGKTVTGAAGGLAAVGTDIFAHIILSIIAIAVMWMGVKTAVSYDEVTKAAFAPFEKFGNSVGNFAKNIPSYLPTPHPAMAPLMPSTYSGASTQMDKNVYQTTTDRKTSSLANILGTDGTKKMEALMDATTGATDSIKKFADEGLGRLDTGERKSNKFGIGLNGALNKFDINQITNPDERAAFTRLKTELSGAKTQADAAKILIQNTNDVDKIQNAGLKALFAQAKSSVPTSSEPAAAALTGANSLIGHTVSNGVLRTTNANSFDASSTAFQQRVKSEFVSLAKISVMTLGDIKDGLGNLGLPLNQLNLITEEPAAKAIATELARGANLPAS